MSATAIFLLQNGVESRFSHVTSSHAPYLLGARPVALPQRRLGPISPLHPLVAFVSIASARLRRCDTAPQLPAAILFQHISQYVHPYLLIVSVLIGMSVSASNPVTPPTGRTSCSGLRVKLQGRP